MTVSATNFRRIRSGTLVAASFALAGTFSCGAITIRDFNVRIGAPSSQVAPRCSDNNFQNANNATLVHEPGDRGLICADLARD